MGNLGRRRFLKVCAAGGVASSVGLAGCSQLERVGEEVGLDVDVEALTGESESESESTLVRDSLYAPDVHEEIDHYGYLYASPETIADHDTDLADEFVESFAAVEDRFEEMGLDFDDLTGFVYYDHGQTVVTGDIPVDTVEDNLDSMGFRSRTEEDGFELFASASGTAGVALSEDLLLTSRPVGSLDAEDVIETTIEARNGETDRYVEEHPAFDSLLGALGDATVAVGRTQDPPKDSNPTRGQFEGVIARGMGVSIAESDSTVRIAFEFDDDTEADEDEVEAWIDETDNLQEPFSPLEDIETEEADTSVVVTAEISTEDLHPDIFPSF